MGCGIGGIIPKESLDLELAETAVRLTESLQRMGMDAWGYYDGKELFKEPRSFSFSSRRKLMVKTLVRKKLYLCHTRLATVGNPRKNKNNHPFILGNLIMAHNGMLYHYDSFPNPEGIETDSYALLYWIHAEYQNTGNTVEAIRRGVRHVSGSYAIWLHNTVEGKTYVFCVEDPLLELMFYLWEDFVMFASDLQAIVDALGENPISMVSMGAVYRAKPYTIYVLEGGKARRTGTFTPNEVTPYSKFKFYMNYHTYWRYHLMDGMIPFL